MKGGVSSLPVTKKRWKGFAVTVLALVVLSLVVPLLFLLGFQNRFPAGYYKTDADLDFGKSDLPVDIAQRQTPLNVDERVEDIIERVIPVLPKESINENFTVSDGRDSRKQDDLEPQSNNDDKGNSQPKSSMNLSEGLASPQVNVPILLPTSTTRNNNVGGGVQTNPGKVQNCDATEKSCQLRFGSYCLWCREHREEMKDHKVKKMKDQLFVARAYYPSIAKLKGHEKLTREMRQNIQEHERILSDTIDDANLPPNIDKVIQRLEATVAKARSFHVDCSNVEKKLRQILDLTEDEANFHLRQSAFLYHLGVQTMPKSLHCLSMRLTMEYFRSDAADMDSSSADKHNPDKQHYVVFSRNVLASSVVINSTVMHAEDSGNLVFHLLTDEENYFAMKFWYSKNSFEKASIYVLNVEEFKPNYMNNLNLSQISFSEEFRISIPVSEELSPSRMRTEYISVFGHAHFLLPDVLKSLKRVVILDDDVVVQRDLLPLWNLDLGDKVNAAIQFCGVRFGQLKSYFGRNSYDSETCSWMSGVNIIDLEKWREHNISGSYQHLLQEQKSWSEESWRTSVLPASMLAFKDRIFALEDSWILSGLGHDYRVDPSTINRYTALHYNGNMKPWLELGISEYKSYWKKFLKQNDRFMDECNVNL
ncbi:putative galacturonosyltransferase 7 [Acorus calamus]|uniref:Hexosyltransferase n=1 Tax=Acorus calamus TaxID=4465 RepID=A0AAV9F8N6_ACOCL|nr:putative galacturonosyltransferase 7 [Acorus calamus]